MRRLFILGLVSLSSCGDLSVLDNFEPGNELVVVTRNGPTTYYLGADEPAGFDYELVRAFAEAEDMSLRVKVAFTLEGYVCG